MYTLIGTAKLNDIDPQAWLADVLERIADHPIQRLPELLPWNWRPAAAALQPQRRLNSARTGAAREATRPRSSPDGYEQGGVSASDGDMGGGDGSHLERCVTAPPPLMQQQPKSSISEPCTSVDYCAVAANTSNSPLVSSDTNAAFPSNVTNFPSAEIFGFSLVPFPSMPFRFTLIRFVCSKLRSYTKTSRPLLLSPATKFDALQWKATSRPVAATTRCRYHHLLECRHCQC